MTDDFGILLIVAMFLSLLTGIGIGRVFPKHEDLRMAYLQGRIDSSDNREEPEDPRYRMRIGRG